MRGWLARERYRANNNHAEGEMEPHNWSDAGWTDALSLHTPCPPRPRWSALPSTFHRHPAPPPLTGSLLGRADECEDICGGGCHRPGLPESGERRAFAVPDLPATAALQPRSCTWVLVSIIVMFKTNSAFKLRLQAWHVAKLWICCSGCRLQVLREVTLFVGELDAGTHATQTQDSLGWSQPTHHTYTHTLSNRDLWPEVSIRHASKCTQR